LFVCLFLFIHSWSHTNEGTHYNSVQALWYKLDCRVFDRIRGLDSSPVARALELTQPLTEMSTRNLEYGNLNTSEAYGPLRPVTEVGRASDSHGHSDTACEVTEVSSPADTAGCPTSSGLKTERHPVSETLCSLQYRAMDDCPKPIQ
jgi:hypothetical protein